MGLNLIDDLRLSWRRRKERDSASKYSDPYKRTVPIVSIMSGTQGT